MTKPECADYLRGAGLNNVYISRDDGMPLHAFKIPSRGHNFAQSPRGPSVEELRQTVYDIMSHICCVHWSKHDLKLKVGPSFLLHPTYAIFNRLNFSGLMSRTALDVGRDMAWIASEFARRAHRTDCAALIRHAHESLDEWIPLDKILHGNHLAIQIAVLGIKLWGTTQIMRNKLSLKDYKTQKNTLFTLK